MFIFSDLSLQTTQDAACIVDDLLGTIDCGMTRLAVGFTGVCRTSDFLEDVCLVRVQFECFDDVFTLGLIRRLILSLGMRHMDEVIIYPSPGELGFGLEAHASSSLACSTGT